MIRSFILLSFLFFSIAVFAQPANDDCSGAQTITPNGTCFNGTTVGANDNWQGAVGCQSGNNHPEVWYTFVATGTSLAVNVTAGTLTGNIEFILVASTSACNGLTNAGSLCGNSPLTGTITGLQIGTTYYYTISSSTSSQGTFTTCVTNSTPPPQPGQDCATSAILCNSNSFPQGTYTGVGIPENIMTNSCFGGNERQSKWYKFTVGCNGTLGFVINPNNPSDDYDWAIWNSSISPCATTMPAPVACNWSGCPGSTGLSDAPSSEANAANCAGPPGPCGTNPKAYCNETVGNQSLLNVTAGSTFTILIDNFTANGNGFTFSFRGDAAIGPDAEFSYAATSCGTYNFTKTCLTTNSSFLWQFGDGSTSTAQNASHTFASSGSYVVTLQVTDALGCIATYSQTIIITAPSPPAATSPQTFCSSANPTVAALTATGTALQWYSAASGGSPLASSTPLTSATYYVSQTISGCESTRTPVTVTVSTLVPLVAITASSTSICTGQSVTFTATPTNGGTTPSYQWKVNGINAGTNAATFTSTTLADADQVSVVMTSSYPCATPASANSATVTISVNKVEGIQYPFVTALPNVPLVLQARTLGNNYSYEWSPPDGLNFSTIQNPTYKYDRTTEYKIKITSELGCITIDTLVVKINALTGVKPDVMLPKAWSPNGDGHNDYLFPLNINIKELKYFRIFNRWGQLMFETSEMLKGWNGILNGKAQPMDVYSWDVEAIGVDGQKVKRSGNSVLLR